MARSATVIWGVPAAYPVALTFPLATFRTSLNLPLASSVMAIPFRAKGY